MLERIGSVAYRLHLPASSTVHLVFHVSQLKSAVGHNHVLVPQLPTDVLAVQVPVQILQRRMVDHGGELIAQVKVRWSGMLEELATWKDAKALRARFPAAQVVFQARGNVSTDEEQSEKDIGVPADEERGEGAGTTNSMGHSGQCNIVADAMWPCAVAWCRTCCAAKATMELSEITET